METAMTNNLKKQRIVVNKYTNIPTEIILDAFYSGYGEVILSIRKGEEGIYAKNDAGEVVKLSTDEAFINQLIGVEKERAISAETAISKSLEELSGNVETLLTSNIMTSQDLTRAQYDELVEKKEIVIDGKIITYNENVYYMIHEE
jgi:hypothetical protein